MNKIDKQELKEICWKQLVSINDNKMVKQNPNASNENIRAMIKSYNYGNYLTALVLKEEGWKLKLNEDKKAIDLVGTNPEGNKVSVEVKTEFYPSQNFFVEIKDACWGEEKTKDYWELALAGKPVYFASVCGNSKTLHLYDLKQFAEHREAFREVRSRFQTTGYLWDKNTNYPWKVGVYQIGV